MFTLADILEALTGQRPENGSLRLSKAVVDALQAAPGTLYVALLGKGGDGHESVLTAFERGAKVAIVEREVGLLYPVLDLRDWPGAWTAPIPEPPFCLLVDDCRAALQKLAHFYRRQLKVRVIGVTGSVGKSTTKDLVAQVLEQRYSTVRNPGNMDNSIGLPLTLLEMGQKHQAAVVEMNLYVPGEVAWMSFVAQPQIGIITNISSVVENAQQPATGLADTIPRSRVELVQALPPAPEGVAVLNFDDPWARDMGRFTRARVFYYGLNPQADLWADGVESDGLEGVRFRLHFRNETLHLRVPLIGRYSVHTALRAAAVGLIEGFTWQEIVNGLRSGHSQIRLVTVRTASGALILDDTYSASPESTLAALNLLEEMDGRKVAVLGEMQEVGPYGGRGHAMVGVRAAEVVDELVTLGERGRIIAASALSSGLGPEQVTSFDENDQVIEFLKSRLQPRDIVLVKGSSELHMDRIAAALEDRE
jgi:UDP-N-acetylmuramoyl-tripeptide--D-alanyl-D-alanine ligase